MMLADSAGELDVVANDSGLCVYVCVQPQNTAENRKVLLRITASVFRNIFTEAENYCPTLTVSHPVSFLSSRKGICLMDIIKYVFDSKESRVFTSCERVIMKHH